MTYRIIILLHVVGVVILLGNFVASWLIFVRARQAQDPAVIASLFGVVTMGDRWLTPISVVVILVSGVLAAMQRGLSITGTGWVFWSLVALGFSGVVFVARLNGLQHRLEAAGDGTDMQTRRRMLASWALWASVGTAAILVALGLMVLRPDLPGF